MNDNSSAYDKNVHPIQRANIFSKLFFIWGLPIFYKGWHSDLDEDDLHLPLKEHESHRLGDKLEMDWKLEKMSFKTPKLARVLFRIFHKEIIFYGFVLFILEFGLRLCQPLALGKLIDFYTPEQTQISQNEAYIYAGFIVLSSFLYVLINHWYLFCLQHLGMKMRIACCSLIYRKSLKLSKTALDQTTIGQMINLLSNDVNRFDEAFRMFHYIWVAPLETLLIMYLLYNILGLTAIVGFSLLLIFIPIQLMMGLFSSKFRLQTAEKTDERVRLMSEIINSVQVIKMYMWEDSFKGLVTTSRTSEMQQIKNISYLRALYGSFNKIITRTSVFLCIIAYALQGHGPTAEYVYVISSFYNLLKDSMTTNFPQAIASFAETLVSIKRIEQFLQFDEIYCTKAAKNAHHTTAIQLKNISAQWKTTGPTHLKNISLKIQENEKIAIIGPVGSGKTTLLNLILKELNVLKGLKSVNGQLSYSPQEPWLFPGTIRQNILFGQAWSQSKYTQITKACALEKDFLQWPYGDKTILGDRGVSLSGGQKARINLARAIYRDADFYLLDDPLSAVDAHVGKQIFEDCILKYLHNKSVVLVTHQLQYLQAINQIYLMESGGVVTQGTYDEIRKSRYEFARLLRSHELDDNDELEEEPTLEDPSFCNDEPTEIKEHRSRGCISSQVYFEYIRAGGGFCSATLVLTFFILCQLTSSGADYFISFWVNFEQTKEKRQYESFYKFFDDVLMEDDYIDFNTTTAYNIGFWDMFYTTEHCFWIYSTLVGLLIFITIIRSIIFYRFCLKASQKLHSLMFNSVLSASMHFFNTNPAGRILNRFSKDMGAIDEICPNVLIDTLQIALNVFAVNAMIASVNPWILIPTFIIVCLFCVYRTIYLSSSRNLKRIESTTRSPVFSHISSSLQGLTTIRAFGAQNSLRQEFDQHQDQHSSAYYLFIGCNRTFSFWLDFHCVIYITLVTLSFFFMGNETYGGNVGLAITQAISLTGLFQWGMRQWSELENTMTSVERVCEYTEIESDEMQNTNPHKTWPEQGCLEFQSVYLRYALNEPYVLNNLTFKIHPSEKVGIVGRTGAGKSSLITALFHLATTEGKILIDGLNTSDLNRKKLRSKISIIPQQPIIFSGTLRSNLDPFNEHNDQVLWNAIQTVHLKSFFPQGLETIISENGSNLSVGQRQLICLARAIIRNNKIVLLDEATANVDPKTDQLIQTTIRSYFAKCTVLTIAHRLHTIMDSDKVLVMDAGKAIEFDHPYNLLQNPQGEFFKLVKETGRSTAQHLMEISKNSHERLPANFNNE